MNLADATDFETELSDSLLENAADEFFFDVDETVDDESGEAVPVTAAAAPADKAAQSTSEPAPASPTAADNAANTGSPEASANTGTESTDLAELRSMMQSVVTQNQQLQQQVQQLSAAEIPTPTAADAGADSGAAAATAGESTLKPFDAEYIQYLRDEYGDQEAAERIETRNALVAQEQARLAEQQSAAATQARTAEEQINADMAAAPTMKRLRDEAMVAQQNGTEVSREYQIATANMQRVQTLYPDKPMAELFELAEKQTMQDLGLTSTSKTNEPTHKDTGGEMPDSLGDLGGLDNQGEAAVLRKFNTSDVEYGDLDGDSQTKLVSILF